MSDSAKRIVKNSLIIAAFPLAMALIMEIWILLAGADTHIITGVLDLQNIVRRTAI